MNKSFDMNCILTNERVRNIQAISESFYIQAQLDAREDNSKTVSQAFISVLNETVKYDGLFNLELAQMVSEKYSELSLEAQIKVFCELWLKECDLQIRMYKYRTNYLMDKLDSEQNSVKMTSDCYLLGFFQEMLEKVKEYVDHEYPEVVKTI